MSVVAWIVLVFIYVAAIMFLTRQPLFKDARIFFHFRRCKLSFAYTIQHNHGEIMCKRSMSSKAKDVGLDRQALAPVRHSYVLSLFNWFLNAFNRRLVWIISPS